MEVVSRSLRPKAFFQDVDVPPWHERDGGSELFVDVSPNVVIDSVFHMAIRIHWITTHHLILPPHLDLNGEIPLGKKNMNVNMKYRIIDPIRIQATGILTHYWYSS